MVVEYLQKVNNKFFANDDRTHSFLEILAAILKNEFRTQEIDFLKKCVDENANLEAIELALRSKKKDNIISFVLVRLSALAETMPQNQSLYVNKKAIGVISVFIFLSTTVINFLLLKLKAKIIYKNLIKEYPNV